MSSVTNPRHSRDKMRTRCARVARGILLNQCLHREVMASGYQPGMDRAGHRVRRMSY